MIFFQLFYEFFKIGLFMIGGGMAAVPFLQELSIKTNWFTQAQLADMIAISESTPGPIGINMATYVGYTVGGIPGGLIASIGLILPSTIIVLTVARLLSKFKESKIVESTFYGLRPASVGLISAAALSVIGISLLNTELWRRTRILTDLFSFKSIIFAVVLFFLVKKIKAHPIVFIAASAAIGIIFKF